MSDQEIQELDYQAVRRRVVRRFIKRLLFAINAFIWLILAGSGAFRMGNGPLGFLWFLLLVAHFVYAFEIWSRTVDRVTQREIEALQRKGYRVTPSNYPASRKEDGKQKREQVARLSDDGEIVYEEAPRTASRRGK